MNMFPSKTGWAVVAIFILVMQRDAAGIDIPLDDALASQRDLEDVKLNFTELALKYAGVSEEHDVITNDGYILKLFRVPNATGNPVLVQHGALGSADDFLLRGSTSLVVELYTAGYDVWVSNVRGNKYSQRHLTLDPDIDKQFWQFTLQEVVVYDITAIIDYILEYTDQNRLVVIGFSVGTSMFYALGSEKPDYMSKISLMISLAPICYTYNSLTLSAMNTFWPVADRLLETSGVEMISSATVGQSIARSRCLEAFGFLGRTMSSAICLQISLSFTPGFDTEEIEPEFTPVIMAHYPSSTSRMLFIHFAQIGISRRFAKYDYGLEGNIIRYGSAFPPAYDLSLVDMPIVLISGKGDTVSTLKDVELLKPQLPNLVGHIILEPENFNHIDFMWGKHTKDILHPYIFRLLNEYI